MSPISQQPGADLCFNKAPGDAVDVNPSEAWNQPNDEVV